VLCGSCSSVSGPPIFSAGPESGCGCFFFAFCCLCVFGFLLKLFLSFSVVVFLALLLFSVGFNPLVLKWMDLVWGIFVAGGWPSTTPIRFLLLQQCGVGILYKLKAHCSEIIKLHPAITCSSELKKNFTATKFCKTKIKLLSGSSRLYLPPSAI
jgi:hypothetical protein